MQNIGCGFGIRYVYHAKSMGGRSRMKLYWRIKVNGRWTWKPAKVLQRESPGRDFVVVEVLETEEE